MTKIEIKLLPFPVPDLVYCDIPPGARQEGFFKAASFSIKDVSDEHLEQLCKNFRDAVFAKKTEQNNLLRPGVTML